MSKRLNLFAILVLALMVMFTVSCEGPAGEDGADGAAGMDGADGMDGVDANSFCVNCHTADNWDMKTAEYLQTGHATAGALDYAGGRGSCSRCHSAEGFAGYLLGYPGEDLTQKSALSCQSCHGNHSSLEEDVVAAPLATYAPVKLIVDETIEVDFEGPSNLCANCHNSRRSGADYDIYDADETFTRTFTGDNIAVYQASPALGPAGTATLNSTSDTLTVVFDVPTTHVYVSSTHAGPHYGAQTNTVFGLDGYGTSSVGTHKEVGCVGCHMGASTETAGGHTLNPNLANCTEACHTTVTDFAAFVTEKHDAVGARMDAIADKLEEIGALDADHDLLYSSLTRDHFEAFWNYRIMYQDHSYGVHNPGYYNTMLTTAEAKLGL